MTYRIVTTTHARKDIQQAIDWEEQRNKGLGKRFLADLEQRLSDIATIPAIGSVRYEGVRCTTTEIFQYLIHYIPDENTKTITVLRVLHTSRRPIW